MTEALKKAARGLPRLYLALDDLRCVRPFMADFFKVMRNHRVSCVLTMQQDEQWDLLNLAPMKNVIRGLLSLKMFYRPETLEGAERTAMLLKRYDAMGDTRKYEKRGTSNASADAVGEQEGWSSADSESDGAAFGDGTMAGANDGWQLKDGDAGGFTLSGGTNTGAQRSSSWQTAHGRNSGTSGGTSTMHTDTVTESLSEELHIVGAREQAFTDAQHLLSFDMHRHDAVVRWEDPDGNPSTEIVRVTPFNTLPTHRDGRPVLAQYRNAVARFTRRTTRVPYKPGTPTTPTISMTPEIVRPADPLTTPNEMPSPPMIELFPPRAGDLVQREMRAIYTLEAVATIHLCTVQILMLLFDWSYDKAYRELEGLVAAGFVDRIKGFAPRGEGSVATTYVINGTGASALADHGRDRDELQRVAKNLGVYRRAIEENRPTQEKHRASSAMLATLLIASARTIDPGATVMDLRFDRERTISVDLATLGEVPPRDRALITPDPTKNTVSYVPDFSFALHWTVDGKPRTDAIFGEVETGFGERDAFDLAVGKAWKIRGLIDRFAAGYTMSDVSFERGTVPRVVVWSRTSALEQRFFEGSVSVFKDRMSPLWLTNGDVLPLAIPTGTPKKGIAAAVKALAANVQQPVWRWLRFPDPNDRRRFVGVRRAA